MGNHPANPLNRWLASAVLGVVVGVVIVTVIGFLSMEYRETQKGFTYEIQMSFQQIPGMLFVIPAAILIGIIAAECFHQFRTHQRGE